MTIAELGKFDRLFIDGEWVMPAGSDRIEVISPYTEEVVAAVPSATAADVDRAVAAARRAFDHGPWPRTDLADRIPVMRRLRELIEQRRETLASVVTAEMGSPITQSRKIQLGTPLDLIDAYIEVASSFPFESVRTSATGTALVSREPVGVVAAVVPWNVPVTIALQKLVPALLTGCTAVLKPAPETPLSAYLLAELFQEAGVPEGVVNVVPADREMSEYLVGHPGVDKVTFTGSTGAGRRIASVCGQNLTRVTLELGGKSAGIVLDDADLDYTVEKLRMGSLRNSGQICHLKTRLLVSRRLQDEFVGRLQKMIESMPVGDPNDPATQIGPLASARQRSAVEGYIQIGRDEGAKAIMGGGRPEGLDRGWFVEPTVFVDVKPDMRIAQEEIFGPVLTVLTYEDEDEAVAIANNSSYGLSGAVFTEDVQHGLAVARKIRTGTVELNGNSVGFLAPTGGFKDSGIGREAGAEGLEAYMEPKSYGLPSSGLPPEFGSPQH
jgi:aldehyde dehydrogenase (NAD+)